MYVWRVGVDIYAFVVCCWWLQSGRRSDALTNTAFMEKTVFIICLIQENCLACLLCWKLYSLYVHSHGMFASLLRRRSEVGKWSFWDMTVSWSRVFACLCLFSSNEPIADYLYRTYIAPMFICLLWTDCRILNRLYIIPIVEYYIGITLTR